MVLVDARQGTAPGPFVAGQHSRAGERHPLRAAGLPRRAGGPRRSARRWHAAPASAGVSPDARIAGTFWRARCGRSSTRRRKTSTSASNSSSCAPPMTTAIATSCRPRVCWGSAGTWCGRDCSSPGTCARAVRRETPVAGEAAVGEIIRPAPQVPDPRPAVRIGYQQFGLLWLLRACGGLERAVSDAGLSLRWIEFASGPELVDALRSDDLDLGVVGEAPPLLAQAAHAPLVYLAAEPPAPEAEAIIVPRDSTLTRVADLRGQRVAVTRGSNAHYLLLRALDEAGVPVAAVDVVFCAPAEARRQFEAGVVAAWVIWDPLLASVQHADRRAPAARRDRPGQQSRVLRRARTVSLRRHPELVDAFLVEIAKLGRTANENPEAVVALLGDSVGIARPALVIGIAAQPLRHEAVRRRADPVTTGGRRSLVARQADSASHLRRRRPLEARTPGGGALLVLIC